MATGDKSACADLYDRFARPLYSVAVRILGDPIEAQDVIHDVFLALWKNAGSFEATRGAPLAWALTLTRNRAIDRLRTRRRRAALLDDTAPADLPGAASAAQPDSVDGLVFKERAGAVRAALADLPPDQMRALELAYFSNLTQQEIAAHLDAPISTIKARIRRGLLKLRDALAHRHD